MSKEVSLLTPLSDFEALHKLADGRKATVSVEREVLARLLVDHSVLVNACKGAMVKVIEPAPRRARPSLT